VANLVDGWVRALTVVHPAAASYRVGYRGNRRFLKLLADFSGCTVRGSRSPL
jgi:hypothetical protein